MPSSPSYKRNYKQEQKTATARGEDKDRAQRNKARRIMERKHSPAMMVGKDVDHKTPMRGGGKTTNGNIRLRERSANRSDNGHKKR